MDKTTRTFTLARNLKSVKAVNLESDPALHAVLKMPTK